MTVDYHLVSKMCELQYHKDWVVYYSETLLIGLPQGLKCWLQ